MSEPEFLQHTLNPRLGFLQIAPVVGLLGGANTNTMYALSTIAIASKILTGTQTRSVTRSRTAAGNTEKWSNSLTERKRFRPSLGFLTSVGVAGAGGYAGYLVASRPTNAAAEGTITSFDQRNALQRMNYSTAGLVQALHNINRRDR
jgi:hypothetical protein